MKIRANRSRCEGHGMCFIVEQDLFPLDDDGFIAVTDDLPVPAGRERYAREGVDACPERALEILDD